MASGFGREEEAGTGDLGGSRWAGWWDGGAHHRDVKCGEGSEFGHAAGEMPGGVSLVGSVSRWLFSTRAVVGVSMRDISPG